MDKFAGEEQRRHPRYLAENLRIILKDDKNFKGEKIRDISLGGVFIRTEDPCAPGTFLTLTLDPQMGLGNVKVRGEVVAVNRGEYAYEKGMHVKFLEMPSHLEEKLTKLFKDLKKS